MQYTSEYNTPVQGCLGVYLDVASTQQGCQMTAGTGLQVWVPGDESDARQPDALRLSCRRDHLDLHATDDGRDPPAKVSCSERCAAKECDETDQQQDWRAFQGLRGSDGHRSFNPLARFLGAGFMTPHVALLGSSWCGSEAKPLPVGPARGCMVPSTGVEPVTYRLGGDCSILLSYEGERGVLSLDLKKNAIRPCPGIWMCCWAGFHRPGRRFYHLSRSRAGYPAPGRHGAD
jgi:hypothetical protein